MSVLDRGELEESPLADLHTIASELGIDSFRRLRKADLIEAIVERQGGDAGGSDDGDDDETPAKPARRSRSRRTTKAASKDDGPTAAKPKSEKAEDDEPDGDDGDEDDRPAPRASARRGGRGGRGRTAAARDEHDDDTERSAEGVVELLENGSAFIRVNAPDASDDDVYVSAAQVRRCELIDGDKVSGPVRPPRRSERFASLIRVETINGRSADEVAAGAHYDDLPAALPAERITLGSDDPTVKAIEWLTPFGKGSRVAITGAARAGKTEALRLLAAVLAGQEGLEVTLALAGVRPEEISEWKGGELEPVAAASFASSSEAQAHAVERAVEQAKRVAARGGDAVVLIDTLDGLHGQAARKALAAARNLADSGSVTIIATATKPLGGETTVIALDARLAGSGRFPALDLGASGTLRPELLVGEAGAEAIAKARAEALG
jgi:transcription termination factor Rho